MRMRTFTAPSMAEAMRLVKGELGEDAIILSSRSLAGGFEVAAAVDPKPASSETAKAPSPLACDRAVDAVAKALLDHGVPTSIIDRLATIMDDISPRQPKQALNAALRAGFDFRPIQVKSVKSPILLVGLPGAGKTSTAARLAAMAKSAERGVTLVTCDLAKAGAVEQLAVYARAMGAPAYRAKDAEALQRAVARANEADLVIVDTVGCSPFIDSERLSLQSLAEAIKTQPIWVHASGGDPVEAGELAACYAGMGVKLLIATKLDVSRRLGGVMAAADGGKLAFACFGLSPEIAYGLRPAEAPFLCERLMRSPLARPGQASATIAGAKP